MSNKFKLEYSLPYWIPFDHNMYIEKWEADVKYRIWIEEERGVKIVRENQSHYPITVFIIEIEDNIEQTYLRKQFHSETINRIFEHGLNLVNQLIDLIRSDSDLLYLQNIATTDLPPVITLSINNEKFPYITCPHRLIGENRRVISQDQFKSIWRKLDSNESLPYLHYFDKARSDFILGRNSEAIINLQISFESYVRYLIIEFARKENLSEAKTEAVLNSKFRHQIEHFLSKKLCRDLSYDKN
ncbi:hypothetical protein EHQ57_11815 [Leptospira wolffii]|uniref:hypothetical protein n=2 Tax=Leptospira wolffii TaxID=409998 RepID=UPI001082B81B|nr:hypothetical protein [Leptospira wolffii]TGK71122.1 hypothetical protein EHQ35_13340 [Leptospira wolffii]TGL29600.1 hypothetical protein EHQ57_11815 [Leptospira wolffii]